MYPFPGHYTFFQWSTTPGTSRRGFPADPGGRFAADTRDSVETTGILHLQFV